MFLSLDQISESHDNLEAMHPFYGISFLVCKASKLPVGDSIEFPIDAKEKLFLDEHYKPDRNSKYYYRVFRPSDKSKTWLSPKYASSGSQSTRTKRGFGDAFIHERNTNQWGWHLDYVDTLRRQLLRGELIHAFHLAVWLYREREWKPDTSAGDILDTFFADFFITAEERRALFEQSVPQVTDPGLLFQEKAVTWRELRTITGNPPDAAPDEGGTLTYLEIQAIGPARKLKIEPADRLNLITGDNGLGKTFLLECAWWALTGQWAGLPAYPRPDAKLNEPKISFQISSQPTRTNPAVIPYNWQLQSWPPPRRRPTIPGLLIYARVDGSFAVWDPAKDYWGGPARARDRDTTVRPFAFTSDQVWDGLQDQALGKTRSLINGLLRDWITWQSQPERYPFETFTNVIRRLSPRDLGPLKPGQPVRLPYDAREIPTLQHRYGEVPIVHAAAGVRRIITLAYLIVWAWNEHRTQSELLRKKPQRRMVILIDEIEAHLHPQWQRTILPALLDMREDLASDLQIQLLVATHSPLVMVSLEPIFAADKDKLFHLTFSETARGGNEVTLEETEFVPYGRVDAWLTSDIFELQHARSLEAERAIEMAKKLQLQDDPSSDEVRRVSDLLVRYLAPNDDYWPRWKYFAEQHGAHL